MLANCPSNAKPKLSPTNSKWSDEELLMCARSGNDLAWELLLSRHQDTFFRLAMSVVKNEAAAADIVQVALINIYSKIDTFDGRAAFSSWANRVVFNAALMHLRRNRRRRETSIERVAHHAGEQDLPSDECHSMSVPEPPDEAYSNRQLGSHILDAIASLDPKYRRIIELREFGGLSMVELGDELGLSVGGAKTRLHRARDFLRVALRRHYPELSA